MQEGEGILTWLMTKGLREEEMKVRSDSVGKEVKGVSRNQGPPHSATGRNGMWVAFTRDSPNWHLKHSQTHAQLENTCYFVGMHSWWGGVRGVEGRRKGENGNLHTWEGKWAGDGLHRCATPQPPFSLEWACGMAWHTYTYPFLVPQKWMLTPLGHPGITDAQADWMPPIHLLGSDTFS